MLSIYGYVYVAYYCIIVACTGVVQRLSFFTSVPIYIYIHIYICVCVLSWLPKASAIVVIEVTNLRASERERKQKREKEREANAMRLCRGRTNALGGPLRCLWGTASAGSYNLARRPVWSPYIHHSCITGYGFFSYPYIYTANLHKYWL